MKPIPSDLSLCHAELRTLRKAVGRLHLTTDVWGEGEYIALNEHGVVGGTLSRDEREALDACRETS